MLFDKDKKKLEKQRTIRIDEEIEKTKHEIIFLLIILAIVFFIKVFKIFFCYYYYYINKTVTFANIKPNH